MEQAITNARKGSIIIIVGVFGEKPVVDIGIVQDRELTLKGTLMYQKEDFLEVIRLVTTNKIDLKKVISHFFSFSDTLDYNNV